MRLDLEANARALYVAAGDILSSYGPPDDYGLAYRDQWLALQRAVDAMRHSIGHLDRLSMALSDTPTATLIGVNSGNVTSLSGGAAVCPECGAASLVRREYGQTAPAEGTGILIGDVVLVGGHAEPPQFQIVTTDHECDLWQARREEIEAVFRPAWRKGHSGCEG